MKEHARAKAACKAFGDTDVIDLFTTAMKDDGGEPAGELLEALKSLRETADATESNMGFIYASAHAILFLRIINLLREEALRVRSDQKHVWKDQITATRTEQSFFDALARYLHECEGLGARP